MLSSFPWPDGAKFLAEGDSTLDAAFPHQLTAALVEKIMLDKNPVLGRNPTGAKGSPLRRFSFVNRGVSGREISDVNAALAADITTYQPTHHILACGINDVQRGTPLATSEAEFDAYLDATAGAGLPTLCLLPFFWVGMGTEVAAFNAAMTTIATSHAATANIMVVNQYTLLDATNNSVAYTSPDTDIAHPNAAWRAALCAAVRPLISV